MKRLMALAFSPFALFPALGLLLLAWIHFEALGVYPGLHFDEAWAMNYAWRIVNEPGFWPLTAMSPYTAPWTHYWAALWMKILGPSLLVFRASQVTLSLFGLLCLHLSLPRGSRFFFPWALFLLPGLLLNHRFAIELTGFHVLCFGLLAFGLRYRTYTLAFAAALLGTTAHILFYGVALGLLFALSLEGKEEPLPQKARLCFVAYFALMALFFLRVFFLVPEKGKAGALVLSALGAAAFLFAQGDQWKVWKNPWWARGAGLLSAVFVLNTIFFGQGYWTSSIYTGLDVWSLYPASAPPNFVLGTLALLFAFLLALLYSPAWARRWFWGAAIGIGLMMLKPAPRYHELLLLGVAMILVLPFSTFRPDLGEAWKTLFAQGRNRWLRAGAALSLLLVAYTNLEMSWDLFKVRLEIGARDSALRFLAYKDSSRDFLDKQTMARFLGSSGCKRDDIESHDPRLVESLNALSLGDWPTLDGKCAYGYLARRSEEGATGETRGEFLLKPLPKP